MSNKSCLVILLFGSAALFPLPAQTTFGRITGAVTDPTGAAVPNAKVIIRNTDTQAAREIQTDERGNYSVENLPIGPYRVEVDHPGFKRTGQSGFFVVADGRVTADIQLEVGNASQSVEVLGARAETLNTTSGEIAHVIDSKQLENLGLNGRNYMELLTLIPGVTVTNPDQFSVMTSLSATNQVVNGHRSNQNSITVDGVGNLDGGANGSLINNVSPDFMQEVKIQTSNFSAEYGRSTGAAFNLLTKNGTNAFHGGAFEYFRNDALDARNFFSPTNTELRFNDFGWMLGGPIKRNKLFFFAGEEWKRLRQASAATRVSIPTLAELGGNFSDKPTTIIYSPGTKTPYPGNVIPLTQITPDGLAIANVYKTVIPLAAIYSSVPASNNATFSPPNPLNYREDLGRMDYMLNAKHTFFGRWVDDYNSIYLPFGPGGSLPIVPEIRQRPGKSAMISETWLITPTLVNEVHLGASWNGQRYLNQGDTWERTTQGFTFPRVFDNQGPFVNGIPQVAITSYSGWDSPSSTLTSPTTEIETGDTVSIVHGKHSVRLGVMIIRNRKDQNGRSNYDGNVSFNTSGNPHTTGYAFADALTGYFNSYVEASYDPIGHYRYTEPAVFVDDSWKVARKLTVNLGLRMEYMMPMYSTANNLTDFVQSLYNPAQAVTVNSSGQVVPGSGNIFNGLERVANGVPQSQSWLVPNAYSTAVLTVPTGAPRGEYTAQTAWQPRVGFAYALNEKTVIRGGFGLFYDRIQGNPTFYTLNNPPYVDSASFNYGNLSNITGGATVSAPWGSIQTIDPHMRVPYSEQFSFGIQRELPSGLFVEIEGVGTLSRHLLAEPDINQPSFAVVGSVASTTNENSIRPYPGFSTVQQFISAATGNYYGLQSKVTRRAGRVLFTAAYTFSKVLTDASSDTDNNEDYFNLHSYYGPASFDVRHVAVGTAIWMLPELRDQSKFIRTPFGGWRASAIVHLQSGFYQTVTGSTAILGTRLADYLGGPALLPNPGPNGWYNKAAFAAAPTGRWGTAGAGDIEGPGLAIYNISVMKYFNLKADGRTNIRLQADFINAFNHTNFQPPATTITSSDFGTISSAYPSRNIQLGLKWAF
jgi:hypothetical protein